MPVDLSILVPNISSNILGATTMLARLLQDQYRVEIVGPDFGEGISPMYRDSFAYRVVDGRDLMRVHTFRRGVARLHEAMEGRGILAVKSYMNTVPVAAWHKKKYGSKMLVYLDEWDGALWRGTSWTSKVRQRIFEPHYMLGDWHCAYSERWISQADQVLCTTRFLAERFKGQRMAFGVDEAVFSPRPEEVTGRLRQQLGLEGRKLLVFGGVARPHKGLDVVIDAMIRMQRPEVTLLIAGPRTPYVDRLAASCPRSDMLVCTDALPREVMPDYLSLADVLPIPLSDNLLAQSQMPCKVFEAMAMGKAIVAAAVSDLPEVLGGCGTVVPANDAGAWAQALSGYLDDPAKGQQDGAAARQRLQSEYSLKQTREQLLRVVNGVLA